MKNIIIVFISVFICLGLNSCKKDNISGDSKNLILGSYITLDSVINQNLDFSNDAATVAIQVTEKGSPIESINVYLALGDNRIDATQWKLVKNVPYTGDKTELSVTTAEIAAALAPATLQPGNQYVLENEVVTKDGRKFSDAGTPTSYTSLPAYNFAFTWNATAVCAFDAAASAGTYKIVTDTWVDYHPGDEITVTAGPGANQLSLPTYPSLGIGGSPDQKPTILDVDAETGAVTIAEQPTGSYGDGTPTKISGSGFVFSCTGGISLTLDVNYGGTVYGGQTFVVQKK